MSRSRSRSPHPSFKVVLADDGHSTRWDTMDGCNPHTYPALDVIGCGGNVLTRLPLTWDGNYNFHMGCCARGDVHVKLTNDGVWTLSHERR